MSDPAPASSGLSSRWARFWHAEASPASLALFRILFAYCLWREIDTTFSRSRAAIGDELFHLPYTSVIPPLTWESYELVHALQGPIIALFALGLLAMRRRITA